MQAGQSASTIYLWAGSLVSLNKVYIRGTQGCCELALGHRWQSRN